jgi:hypothetical protein
MYSSEEMRQRRALREAQAAYDRQAKQLEERKRNLRHVKKQVAAIEHHDDWHKYRLGGEKRALGFDGRMAAACAYLNALPLDEYIDALRPYVSDRNASRSKAELAAVKAHLDAWTAEGDAIILRREAERYWADHEKFGKWQAGHPEHRQWRTLPATARQDWLIERTADQLAIDVPSNLNRGAAHDWLRDNGANLRIRGSKPITLIQPAENFSSANLFEDVDTDDD